MAWFHTPENAEPQWQAWVCVDGTVGLLSGKCAWQEWLCDPDEALQRMRQTEDDGA